MLLPAANPHPKGVLTASKPDDCITGTRSKPALQKQHAIWNSSSALLQNVQTKLTSSVHLTFSFSWIIFNRVICVSTESGLNRNFAHREAKGSIILYHIQFARTCGLTAWATLHYQILEMSMYPYSTTLLFSHINDSHIHIKDFCLQKLTDWRSCKLSKNGWPLSTPPLCAWQKGSNSQPPWTHHSTDS